VVARLKGRPEIDDIRHDKQTVERLLASIKMARWIGIIFAVLLGFASLVLIANAIRLAIYARRKEVAIMRLVGASNWFIRWPFLLEGIMQGIIGAVIAALLLTAVQKTIFERIAHVLVFLPTGNTDPFFLQLIIGLVLGGILIGAAGSALALRRFLRV